MEGRGLGVNGNHDNDIGIGNDCIERKGCIHDIYYYYYLPYWDQTSYHNTHYILKLYV